MSQVEKLSIAMTSEMAAELRAAVEAGEYSSVSEAVRDAVRMLIAKLCPSSTISSPASVGRNRETFLSRAAAVRGETSDFIYKPLIKAMVTARQTAKTNKTPNAAAKWPEIRVAPMAEMTS